MARKKITRGRMNPGAKIAEKKEKPKKKKK
jgi:hypothetical protein